MRCRKTRSGSVKWSINCPILSQFHGNKNWFCFIFLVTFCFIFSIKYSLIILSQIIFNLLIIYKKFNRILISNGHKCVLLSYFIIVQTYNVSESYGMKIIKQNSKIFEADQKSRQIQNLTDLGVKRDFQQ